MRALQVRPEGLIYAEVPEPAIKSGDALVRVKAAGNYLDTNTFLYSPVFFALWSPHRIN
jgi:NADPH:quinone reductase-like Zn-dependent oxidoreductase